MPNDSSTKEEIAKILNDFQKEIEDGKINTYQEMDIRTNFIDRFFQILGWDMRSHDEVLREFSTRKQKRADYVFRINNRNVFVVEAKRNTVNLDSEEGEKAFKQAISYAYSNKIKFAVVTNFRQLYVFHALSNPKTPKNNLLFIKGAGYFGFKFSEFLDNFDSIRLLSKESFLNNEMEKLLKEKDIKTSKPIDEAILGDLVEIRKLLSSDIKQCNQDLLNKYSDETNLIEEAVQRLINRLIFIRYTEDRGLEEENLLLNRLKNYQDMTSDKRLYAEIRDVFVQFNSKYNSNLFSLHEIDKEIRISEKVLETVIRILYTGLDKNQEKYNFAHIGVDLLGSIYEQYLGMLLRSTEKRARVEEAKGKRKKMGIYYTPEYIVDYIVKNTIGEAEKGKSIDEILKLKILDPACGSGSFLIKAFDEVCSAVERGLKAGEKSKKFKEFQKYDGRLSLAQKKEILKNTIHGVDLDEKAVEIAQLSLLLKLLENEESHANKMLLPTMTDNIQHGNSLIDDTTTAGDLAFKWESRFRDVFANGGFDVVVGNPPYLNIKSDDILKESNDFKQLSDGVVNTASLFLKKGYDLLKDDGLLGFIIPKSFLIVDSWKPIRRIILENTKLRNVFDVGMAFEEVGLEQVIIIFEKNKPIKNNVIIIKEGKEINSIPQDSFNKRDMILTSLDEEKYKLILKIEKDSIKLGDFSDMPRGITVNSSEYKDKPSDNSIHILGGTNLEKYGIKEGGKRKPNRYLNKNDERLLQKNNIFKVDRIVYQNIASSVPRIIATLVSKNIPTDDTLNNLLILDNSVSNEYILSIINSKLVTFYLRYAIINCSLLTIHLDKSYLGKLPIKIISQKEQQPLIALADRMLSMNKRLREPNISSSERERIKKQIEDADFEIDEMVYRLYGITIEEKKVIEEAVKS